MESFLYCLNFEDNHLFSDVIIIIDSFSKLQTEFLQPVLFQIQLKILTFKYDFPLRGFSRLDGNLPFKYKYIIYGIYLLSQIWSLKLLKWWRHGCIVICKIK